MSGDGNDEEIVKLSIDGKVSFMMILILVFVMVIHNCDDDGGDCDGDGDGDGDNNGDGDGGGDIDNNGCQVQETPEGKDGNKTEFGFKKEKREKSAV